MSNLFNEMMEESSEKDKKIADLETKLAEKEKEITDFELEVGDLRLQNRNLKEQFKCAVQSKNQDKISFAVNNINNIRNNIGNYFMTNKLIWTDKIMVGKICNVINEAFDNQIEELKKEIK